MFADAPILNPYGPDGIQLVIDSTGSVPEWPYLAWADDHTSLKGGFWKLKKSHFDPKRQGLYHYAIWGRADPEGNNGYSNADFKGTKVGDSFMITMSELSNEYHTAQSQAETFVHELGHNLGQKHGGTNGSQYKPNYWSVMSYTWLFRSSSSELRKKHLTCTQIYYATPGAREVNGELPQSRHVRVNYSQGMARSLVGNMDVRVGVCGQPMDWKPVNAGDFSDVSGAPIEDFANWPNLNYNGPKSGGSHNP
jgi:hypothetical protein